MERTTAARLIKSSSEIRPFIQSIPASASFPDIDSGRLLIVRGDCIGAAGEGNKLFKLRYNLPQDCSSRRPIVSVGGPWSNHLHALAHRCAELGLSAHGFVRGLAYASTPTIDSLRLLGMQLHHLDRVEYRRERECQWQGLAQRLGLTPAQIWLLPEGGSTVAAVRGLREWARAIFDVLQPSANSPVTVYVGAGTGATTAGFVCEAPEHTQVIGVPAGRFGQWLQDAMTDAIASQGERIVCEWRLEDRHDPGAFGRMTDSLRDFISDFDREYGIRLDPVYTGKVARVALEAVSQDQRRHVIIHTGGLQRPAIPVIQE